MNFRNMENFNILNTKHPQAFIKRVEIHRDLSLSGKSSNPGDMYNIKEGAFNKSFMGMYNDLEYAIQKRKELAQR